MPRADEVPITVLMPVYNVERYVRGALDSLFRQTWQDFEVLIVNDGSTDGTRQILADTRDPRIRVIDMPHGGLAAVLRCGVEQARGRYLARMDGDDEALPHRLAIQKAYLDRAPRAVLVHSLAQPVDPDGRPLPMVFGDPRPSTVTKWFLLWQNPIVHPTVMLRRSTLRAHDLNYRLEFFRADEFDLWNRLAPYGDFEAIPEVLLRYRLHPQSMTRRNPVDLHAAAFTRVIRENFERLGVPLPASAAEELAVISGGTRIDPIAHRYPHLRDAPHPAGGPRRTVLQRVRGGSRRAHRGPGRAAPAMGALHAGQLPGLRGTPPPGSGGTATRGPPNPVLLDRDRRAHPARTPPSSTGSPRRRTRADVRARWLSERRCA